MQVENANPDAVPRNWRRAANELSLGQKVAIMIAAALGSAYVQIRRYRKGVGKSTQMAFSACVAFERSTPRRHPCRGTSWPSNLSGYVAMDGRERKTVCSNGIRVAKRSPNRCDCEGIRKSSFLPGLCRGVLQRLSRGRAGGVPIRKQFSPCCPKWRL